MARTNQERDDLFDEIILWGEGVDQFGQQAQAWMDDVDTWGAEVDEWRAGVDVFGDVTNARLHNLRARTNDMRGDITVVQQRLTVVERATGVANQVPGWAYFMSVAVGGLAALLWSAADFSRSADIDGNAVVVNYPIAENPIAALVVGALVAIIVLMLVPREAPAVHVDEDDEADDPAQQHTPPPAHPAPQPVPAGGGANP